MYFFIVSFLPIKITNYKNYYSTILLNVNSWARIVVSEEITLNLKPLPQNLNVQKTWPI